MHVNYGAVLTVTADVKALLKFIRWKGFRKPSKSIHYFTLCSNLSEGLNKIQQGGFNIVLYNERGIPLRI